MSVQSDNAMNRNLTRKNICPIKSTFSVLVLLWTCGVCGSEPLPDRDVFYGRSFEVFHRQKLSVTKDTSQINASDLRPEVSENHVSFHYAFLLTLHTPFKELPLFLEYNNGENEGVVGNGWRLAWRLQADNEVALDLLSPNVFAYPCKKHWFLSCDHTEIPAVLSVEEGNEIFIFEKANTQRYRFIKAKKNGEYLALPFRIGNEEAPSVLFHYEDKDGAPRLRAIEQGNYILELVYEAATGSHESARNRPANLDRISMRLKKPGSNNFITWKFIYKQASGGNERYLTGILTERPDAPERLLKFDYQAFKPSERQRTHREQKTTDKSGDIAGAWRKEEGAWLLPKDKGRAMSISTHPGLRFMDLNLDGYLDLVDSQDGNLRSWLFDKNAPDHWKEYTTKYAPYRGSVKFRDNRRPTGSHYFPLVKKYLKYQYDTDRFQSLATSYYQPDEGEPHRLVRRSFIAFPRVKNGRLYPDEGMWDIDDRPLLQLPVPLQYEGTPWPTHIPGVPTTERFTNQGAQFVNFTKNGRINLFYIGLRYRDAQTGNILLKEEVGHRDTGNYAEYYETEWHDQHPPRKVKVDICQAFWMSEEDYWSEWYPQDNPQKPFWRRLDIGPNGKPNGRYVLPKQEDPRYYYHYEGFRNVHFATLDETDSPYATFAVIYGRGGDISDKDFERFKVCDIYGLKKGLWKWELLKKDSEYYPPEPFFEYAGGVFADMNGDGRDDAVLAIGGIRKTYLNLGAGAPQRWLDCPELYLPAGCDLTNGKCQLINLDNYAGDTDTDIFVEDGRVVYINESGTPGIPMSSMILFTDENGHQQSVEAIQRANISDFLKKTKKR